MELVYVLAGAASVLPGMILVSVVAVVAVRWSLREAARVGRDCEQWRTAATNAAIEAHINRRQVSDDDTDIDDGPKWKS